MYFFSSYFHLAADRAPLTDDQILMDWSFSQSESHIHAIIVLSAVKDAPPSQHILLFSNSLNKFCYQGNLQLSKGDLKFPIGDQILRMAS